MIINIIIINSSLKSTSHDILHYMWLVDLSESFSQLIIPILIFPQYLFQ